MQIQTTMKWHLTATRMAKTTGRLHSVAEHLGQPGSPALLVVRWCSPLKTSLQFWGSKRTPALDLSLPLLSLCPKEMKTNVQGTLARGAHGNLVHNTQVPQHGSRYKITCARVVEHHTAV